MTLRVGEIPRGIVMRYTAVGIVTIGAIVAVVVAESLHSTADAPIPGVTSIRVDGWNIAAGSMQAAAPAFHAAHPNIRATVNMAGAQLQARFMLSLSAGVGAPDVSQLQNAEVMRYAVTGRLADLTPLATKYWDAFPESVWKDCTYEGKVYGIPWDLGPCAIFYKRDIFAKYGIEPNAIETWDDYISAGERIVQLSGGKTRMLVHPTSYQEIMFEMLLHQGRGQVFDDQGRVAVNSPIALRVLSIMRRFVDTGISSNTTYWTQPFFASFTKDSVATYPMAVWFGGIVRDYAPDGAGNWGVFPLPAQERGGLRISSFGGSFLVIPDQCHNKEAATAFLEFMLCREDTQLLHYRNFDLFPALTTVYDNPFFDEPVDYFGGQPVRRLFTRDVERIPPMNRTADWVESGLYLRQALGKWAAAGMGDPPGFLAELEAGLARRLDREIAPESLSRKK